MDLINWREIFVIILMVIVFIISFKTLKNKK